MLKLLVERRLAEAWIAPEHILELHVRVRLRKTLIDERHEWQQRIQARLYHQGEPRGIRQGPEVLRWALFAAAQSAARTGSPDHAYYLEVRGRIDHNRAAYRSRASSAGGPTTSCANSAIKRAHPSTARPPRFRPSLKPPDDAPPARQALCHTDELRPAPAPPPSPRPALDDLTRPSGRNPHQVASRPTNIMLPGPSPGVLEHRDQAGRPRAGRAHSPRGDAIS
jgi:hypothetical protein